MNYADANLLWTCDECGRSVNGFVNPARCPRCSTGRCRHVE